MDPALPQPGSSLPRAPRAAEASGDGEGGVAGFGGDGVGGARWCGSGRGRLRGRRRRMEPV
uniref:Uncharacterized protein n=1 Tax=Oryza meridionalis TaxID=40149 RepID=A0A0E0CQD3_9ORYZ